MKTRATRVLPLLKGLSSLEQLRPTYGARIHLLTPHLA